MTGGEEELGLIPELSLRSVSVMHVEVGYRYSLQAPLGTCMVRRHGDIVEQAKAHGPTWFGVVTGRSRRDENRVCVAPHDKVDCLYCCASGPQRCFDTAGAHHRVGIESYQFTWFRAKLQDPLDVILIMNPHEILGRGAACFNSHQIGKESYIEGRVYCS